MKKLILIGIGLACAAGFIGFDAVSAFYDKTRSDVRSRLMTPEIELQAQISEAQELSERCGESVVNGRVALARLDTMIEQRQNEIGRRQKALARDRDVLESRQALLQKGQPVYVMHNEEISRRTLDRDAVLRAKAYATDRQILEQLQETVNELRVQRSQTAAEIEEATVEERRLAEEVSALKAELENLKARRAVAQTREEAAHLFDRSTFDRARDKISAIRTTIAEQNKRLDFYGRLGSSGKGLIPADVDAPAEENGLDAIAAVLHEELPPAEFVAPNAIRR